MDLAGGRLTRREALALGAASASLLVVPRRLVGAGERSDLHAYLQDRMRAGRLPGLSVCVVRDGRIAWSHTYGWANVRKERPVRRDTSFMLGSVSKTVVATAVMQAVEAGLLDLDADVNDVLPFPVRVPEHPGRAITARQLLAHTSGIRDRWSTLDALYTFGGDSPIGLRRFLRGYLDPGGRWYDDRNFYGFRPGRDYRYSNVGTSLAAFLVEVVSGAGFDGWCEERIFRPLRMKTSGWRLADVARPEIAMPYRWSGADQRFLPYGHYGYPDYPDGLLRASGSDVARHLLMFMGGGEWNGARLLEASTVREMRRSQIPDLVPGQGLIWYVLHRNGRRLLGHEGGDRGAATVMFYEPAEGVGVVALANGDWRRDRAGWPLLEILDRLLEEADAL